MDDDATRWNERYAGRAAPTSVAPEALAARLDLVPSRGRALDVACGPGAQTRWLAERGLDVVALDVSPAAIELVGAAVEDAGVAERVDARVVDLDHGLPAGLGRFDVIVCQRFRQPALYHPIVDHLTVGGVAAITVLSEVGLDDAPGPFHAPTGELLRLAERPDVDVLDHTEAAGTASLVVRRGHHPIPFA